VALGATREDVIRLIVSQGIGIAIAGSVIGLAGAFAATRALRTLLYDVQPSDPATFAVIVTVLIASVALASWIPARRASTIDPTEALRGG
jgi:ABC-type lipoprotein release transport system permease subunit